MPNDETPALRALGIKLVDPEVSPEAYAELLRVARRIRESQQRRIGLLPASKRVAVPAVAIQLSVVLAQVCLGSIAFVDANTRWPSLGGAVATVQRRDLARIALHENVVAFARAGPPTDRIDMAWLYAVLDEDTRGFAHVFVDLSGFPRMGEHVDAFDVLDGVLVVARSGDTTEGELVARHGDVPKSKRLGVLLSG